MAKYKIGIVELFFHQEVVLNLYKVLCVNFELSIFISDDIFKAIQENIEENEMVDFIVKRKNQSHEEFLQLRRQEMNKCDLIIFTTVSSSFEAFSKLNLTTKTVLIIHNTNAFFYPFQQISLINKYEGYLLNLSRIIRNVLLRQEIFFKKRFLDNVDFISFPTIHLQEKITKENVFTHDKICPPILFGIHQMRLVREKKHLNHDIVKIVIPGTVHPKNKDYNLVLDALKTALPQLKFKIELILLGKINEKWGIEIISQFQKLDQKKIKLLSFKETIPQDIFEGHLKEADFMILPFPKHTQTSIYYEEYGKTKASGAMLYDVVAYAKPTLVSNHYPLESHHQNYIHPFESMHNLATLIVDWVNERKFTQLELNYSLDNFQKENLQSRLKYILTSLIE